MTSSRFLTQSYLTDETSDGISEIGREKAFKFSKRKPSLPSKPNSFVVQLDVFHQLRFLNDLRRTFFPERYPSTFDDYINNDGQRNYLSTSFTHYGRTRAQIGNNKCMLRMADSCIDALRQSIMCHSEVSSDCILAMGSSEPPAKAAIPNHTYLSGRTYFDVGCIMNNRMRSLNFVGPSRIATTLYHDHLEHLRWCQQSNC